MYIKQKWKQKQIKKITRYDFFFNSLVYTVTTRAASENCNRAENHQLLASLFERKKQQQVQRIWTNYYDDLNRTEAFVPPFVYEKRNFGPVLFGKQLNWRWQQQKEAEKMRATNRKGTERARKTEREREKTAENRLIHAQRILTNHSTFPMQTSVIEPTLYIDTTATNYAWEK